MYKFRNCTDIVQRANILLSWSLQHDHMHRYTKQAPTAKRGIHKWHLIFPILQFEISSWIFFQVWTGFFTCKIQVWNIKLAKSKIPVRVVKNVISKWTKMDFPRFLSFWFIAVAVVNPPDQKLVMYTSVNCRKGVTS